mgnify:FL=1
MNSGQTTASERVERCKTGILRLEELKALREEVASEGELEKAMSKVASQREVIRQLKISINTSVISVWITVTSVILLTGPLTLPRWWMLSFLAVPPLAIWKYRYGR